MRQRKIRNRFVAAYIERAQRQRPAAQRSRDALIFSGLLGLVGRRLALQEKKLRPQQPTPFCSIANSSLGFSNGSHVRQHFNPCSVGRATLTLRSCLFYGSALASPTEFTLNGRQLFAIRVDP